MACYKKNPYVSHSVFDGLQMAFVRWMSYLDLPGFLPGFTWVYLDLPGFTWVYLDLPGFLSGFTWIYLDLPGSQNTT